MRKASWTIPLIGVLLALTTGCAAMRDKAVEMGKAWWNEGGKEMVKNEAKALAIEAKDEAISAGIDYYEKAKEKSNRGEPLTTAEQIALAMGSAASLLGAVKGVSWVKNRKNGKKGK